MKIALISQEFPPYTIGGIATACYDLAYHLSERGIFTTVFCGRSNNVTVERINDNLTIVRMPLYDAPPRHLWFQIQNYKPLLKQLQNYTLIHGFSPKASSIFAYYCKKLKKPFITSIHGFPQNEFKTFLDSPITEWVVGDFIFSVLQYPLNDFLIRSCLNNSNHITLVSNFTLHEMRKRYPDYDYSNTSVIYNGINFHKIPYLNNYENKDEEALLITYFGRLTYRKGITHLIKAISLVKKILPDVKLEIFGKGPLETSLKRLVFKLRLKKNVFIRGFVPKKALIKTILKSSIITLPSLYEAQPISVLEAMAHRKPVVVFDYPFVHEYVKNFYNGILVRPQDIKNLADTICLLLSDEKLRSRLGQNAYNYVKKNHNWEKQVDKYIQIYENAIN